MSMYFFKFIYIYYFAFTFIKFLSTISILYYMHEKMLHSSQILANKITPFTRSFSRIDICYIYMFRS